MLRRHLLKFLAAVFCLSQLTLAVSAQTPTGSYSDVPIESPHYEAIEYLTDMGVTSGVGGGRFAPDNTISFDEFIVMLMKTLQPEAVAKSTLAITGVGKLCGQLFIQASSMGQNQRDIRKMELHVWKPGI